MHKERFSVSKAELSDTREDSYKKYCFDISFKCSIKIEVSNEVVYFITKDEQIKLIEPDNKRNFWFQTWV